MCYDKYIKGRCTALFCRQKIAQNTVESDGEMYTAGGNSRWPAFMAAYLRKMGGGPCKRTRFCLAECLWACAGVTIGIGIVTYLTFLKGIPVLVASLGATACLIFATPASPVAQPRHVVCGQVLSAAIGVIIYHLWGSTWYTATLSASLSVMCMMITRTLHPPAAATAIIAVVTERHWLFPLLPVAIGALILVIAGVVINNLAAERHYPLHWW